MRYILFLSMLLLSGSLAIAQTTEEIKIPIDNPAQAAELHIDIKSGDVTVKGTERQDILVRYTNREEGPLRMVEADNGLKKITGGAPNLEISAHGNKAKVQAQNWQKTLDIYVEVPKNCQLNVSTYNHGKLMIESVVGEITANNFNGPITAQNIAGSLIADSYNGDIKVTFSRVKPDTPMAFTTYNGEIRLTLPAATKATFKMKANDDIYTAFDMELRKDEKVEPDKKRDGYRRILGGWIIGDLNGGGPEFRLETHHGEIYLQKG